MLIRDEKTLGFEVELRSNLNCYLQAEESLIVKVEKLIGFEMKTLSEFVTKVSPDFYHPKTLKFLDFSNYSFELESIPNWFIVIRSQSVHLKPRDKIILNFNSVFGFHVPFVFLNSINNGQMGIGYFKCV